MTKLLFFLISILSLQTGFSQSQYWQQAVDYKMDIKVDVEKNQFSGFQKLTYYNHSPDTLHKVFYHLYYNAFQPGSMMDVRSRTIKDPDPRVMDRIYHLKPDEIGYHHILSLKQNGHPLNYKVDGTILEVVLAKPILPGTHVVFEMNFESQIPLQIRRTGRDNKEGIRYSMSQWYPKLAEYDEHGWHPNEYIGREFHSVWGDFEVNIEIDANYVVAATGKLTNAEDIGHGYTTQKVKHKRKKKLNWQFKAQNVHDFVWAADPDYKHTQVVSKDGTLMHFFYQEGKETEAWKALPNAMSEAFAFVSEKYGKYPYSSYAFIQGGDGGMEYPMATLITGHRSLNSLVGVSVHELLHSWYQMILATNESLYAWMDEGFTSYASTLVMEHLKKKGILPGEVQDNPFSSTYTSYERLAKSGVEEPLTTHADHFEHNYAYSIASYVKGAIFLNQLEYIIGKPLFDRGLLRYFHTWKFKHPNDDRVIRVFEKESDFILDWYQEYWVNSTKTIDYGIDTVQSLSNGQTNISLSRLGSMPMPIDIFVTDQNNTVHRYTIPLRMMRNHKKSEFDYSFTVLPDWPWVKPQYDFTIDIPINQILKIEIDPTHRLADIEKDNNVWLSDRP